MMVMMPVMMTMITGAGQVEAVVSRLPCACRCEPLGDLPHPGDLGSEPGVQQAGRQVRRGHATIAVNKPS